MRRPKLGNGVVRSKAADSGQDNHQQNNVERVRHALRSASIGKPVKRLNDIGGGLFLVSGIELVGLDHLRQIGLTRLELADETARKNFHLPAVGIEDGCTFEHMVTAVLEFLLDDVFLGLRIGISRARHR